MISPMLIRAFMLGSFGFGGVTYWLTKPILRPGEEEFKRPDIKTFLKINWWKILVSAAGLAFLMSQLNILKKR